MVVPASDIGSLARWDMDGINVLTYAAAFNVSDWKHVARESRFKDPVTGALRGPRMWAQQCDVLLSDKPLLERLKVCPEIMTWMPWPRLDGTFAKPQQCWCTHAAGLAIGMLSQNNSHLNLFPVLTC